MTGFINNLIEKYDVQHTSPTPAKLDLFQIDLNSPLLDEEMKAEFHSCVYAIMFMNKRIKPETMVVTSVLASRVQCPTEQDWEKLRHLLGYINGSKHLPLCLEMMDEPVCPIVNADTSHGTHGDFRGHGGIVISIGRGTIESFSNKLPINTKSTAETELVGASNGVTPGINVQNILFMQGVNVGPVILQQDNQSTLAMIDNGRSIGPTTRHINIRYFWMKDRISTGDLITEYVCSPEMQSDALSKPLVGNLFLGHRAKLLNLKE
jgi:hypothetical protein